MKNHTKSKAKSDHVKKYRDLVKSVISEINNDVSIHDFRMVAGPTHTNLIFDVLLPAQDKSTDKEVKETKEVKAKTEPEEVRDSSDKKEVKTDNKGYAVFDLPFGVWTFHQVNTNEGFEKIKDFTITVDYNTPKEHYYNVLNNKIASYVQGFKVDEETKEKIAISGVTFKILNTDTNEYVSQFVGGKTYKEFTTDEEGKFMTYLKLEAGNYKLVEVSSPKGYLINLEGLNFKIGTDSNYENTDHGLVLTLTFKDRQIKGQIKVNKTGEKVVIENNEIKYESIPLSKVKFEIRAKEDIMSSDGRIKFYSKDEVVDTIITDSKGYAISKELPLGKYYIVEVETNSNYVLDQKAHNITLDKLAEYCKICCII